MLHEEWAAAEEQEQEEAGGVLVCGEERGVQRMHFQVLKWRGLQSQLKIKRPACPSNGCPEAFVRCRHRGSADAIMAAACSLGRYATSVILGKNAPP